MAPTGSAHASYTLGLLTSVGGLVGYYKSKSKPSLAAGLVLGSALLYGGYLIDNGRPDTGHLVSLGASLALAGAMAPRALRTRRLWPAGALAVAGASSTVYHAQKSYEWHAA